MAGLNIKPYKRIVPMIYCYTTPDIPKHKGWSKIGYTASQTVQQRVAEQTHTADVRAKINWQMNAIYNDGSGETFTDHDFHRFLTDKLGIARKQGTEWFHINHDKARDDFLIFTARDYSHIGSSSVSSYTLRDEQKAAVDKTIAYFKSHKKGPSNCFLWNAKPRFGKTLSAYDLIKKMQLHNVLVVTNRPAIANSWLDDYNKFVGNSFYKFISREDYFAKKRRQNVLTHDQFVKLPPEQAQGRIVFESLQNLKQSEYLGNYKGRDKLKWISELHWDLLIIDEAHEGADTYKVDKAFDKITRDYTLSLTGTPFKALAKGEFTDDQIFNWSYADEQKAKRDYDENKHGGSNPYAVMPKLNMFTYQMSSIMEDKAKHKISLPNGEKVNPAFDLNEFFRVKANGEFVYDEYVNKFLDALTTQKKYPFSTPELRSQLRHTFWLLHRVNSAKALKRKLDNHEVFKHYKVVLAAGNGKGDEETESKDSDDYQRASGKSFDRVQDAIAEADDPKSKWWGTITLSVGQLTTGVTIKPWSGVLMLSNMRSASEYMQAAFRAQNPCQVSDKNGHILQKENCYVFDFDPARTLTMIDSFANNLNLATVNGKGTAKEHEDNIRELLNFFPVIGEDDSGKMVALNPSEVLSIPRHLKSREVVNRGFMSNFLFINIGHVFAAPQVVKEILDKTDTAKEGKDIHQKHPLDAEQAENLDTDENGDIDVPEERTVGKSKELLGSKVYQDSVKATRQKANDILNNSDDTVMDDVVDDFNKAAKENIISTAVDQVTDQANLTKSQANKIKKQISRASEDKTKKLLDDYKQERKISQTEHDKALKQAQDLKQKQEAEAKYGHEMSQNVQRTKQELNSHLDNLAQNIPQKVNEEAEKLRQQQAKEDFENDVRDHLRGFARTIPSFLMAYGDRNFKLSNLDKYVSDDVFEQVTGLTIKDFTFLRDGGYYTDKGTGKTEYFQGHLFDEVVFNDAVQGFLDKKEQLKDYFDESQTEDIFDYIPPQKTNQIFTPKDVVKKMVDELRANNPGVFDDPNKTFADLYMKSGLYITEIIKRLYRSEKMKQLYPDKDDRLAHILTKQVYGLAPTEIIYRIATNYILGFKPGLRDSRLGQNFKLADAAQAAKKGKLQELVDKEFN